MLFPREDPREDVGEDVVSVSVSALWNASLPRPHALGFAAAAGLGRAAPYVSPR